jgi:hypothetical protein
MSISIEFGQSSKFGEMYEGFSNLIAAIKTRALGGLSSTRDLRVTGGIPFQFSGV